MARPCCSNVSTACACKADGNNIAGDGTSLNPFTFSNQALEACNCVVDGTTITGAGTADSPFVAAQATEGCNCVVDGTTITGAGTAEDPFVAAGGGTGQTFVASPLSVYTANFAECEAAGRRGNVYIDGNNVLFTRPAAGCIIIDSRDNPPGLGNEDRYMGMGPVVVLDNSGPGNAFNDTQQSLYSITYTNDNCLPAQVKIESGGWYGRYRLLNNNAVTAGLFTGVQGWINLAVNGSVIDTHLAWEVRDEDLNGKSGESVTHSQSGHYAKVFTIQPGDSFQYDIWSQVFTDERTQGLVTMSGKTSVFINECNDGRL